MLNLIPAVKSLKIQEGYLTKKAISFNKAGVDPRLAKALCKLPMADGGTKLTLVLTGEAGEGYTLEVAEEAITITAGTAQGAFYGIQTLRQLFTQESVPCVHIEDAPDFPLRGFYHDISRGRIPKVETILEMVDQMAYYKLNSFQLYVEYVFPFKETEALVKKTGCITPEELKRIEAHCEENFIEFIPSLSTFGHMFEILNQPAYKHLAILADYENSHNFWFDRMQHHTVNPLKEESLPLVKSLIDQYMPLFKSDTFNICCDETFDLDRHLACDDPGAVYAGFVNQITEYVRSKGKHVMMWADILLKHPEAIGDISEDTTFLNWFYRTPDPEERIALIAKTGRKQIVCPGITNWNRLCEDVEVEEINISAMTKYGKKYGAIGVLNTSWGDWGHPVSVEMGMYGMVLGAEKSWSVETPVDDAFHARVDHLLYKKAGAFAILHAVSRLHGHVLWKDFVRSYVDYRYGEKCDFEYAPVSQEGVAEIQKALPVLREKLAGAWELDNYRKEFLSVAEGLCLLAELSAKLAGREVTSLVNADAWMDDFRKSWRAQSKESELENLMDMVSWYAAQS